MIVAELGIEAFQIDQMVEQVADGVLEGARLQLLVEVYWQEAWAGIDVFVEGHACELDDVWVLW